MMLSSFNTPIWFYPEPVNFRSQIDGLVILASDALEKDPCSGELFIFRNRSANKIKLLWYDRNGFWLCYKRLEKGRFKFPSQDAIALELSRDQLNWLLSGLDMLKQRVQPSHRASHFY